MPTYLGIDIGGTKIAGALVDDNGLVLKTGVRPTQAERGGAQVLQTAIALGQELLHGSEQVIAGAGVGAGGQIDAERGVVVSATEILPGWAGTEIGAAFKSAFGVPVAVDNDVNALAAGEAKFGAARGLSTVVFLALGTGVGGALLLEGRVHYGAHWTGGEFGHLLLTMDPNARKDGGGARGTLEAYASGPGLIQTWREIAGDDEAPITGAEIAADAVQDPGGIGAAAIAQTGRYLGFGLVSLANALDPDVIVIGGGLAALGDALLAPARAVLAERALPGPAQTPVVLASLGEHASTIGAAALIIPLPKAVS
ncbi:transcriptional regulator [Capsulimonas corticalis]|uniref:Transcriptional regulator n=1 Tax=Capsulimonas corticalis TaxID=2219043 RepID=A0A402CRN1_9BACT|nr:ROK family protein [Capsulimonas corticalis]BDI28061.1 transcriptional regulator [Capsulimonas corticalis]